MGNPAFAMLGRFIAHVIVLSLEEIARHDKIHEKNERIELQKIAKGRIFIDKDRVAFFVYPKNMPVRALGLWVAATVILVGASLGCAVLWQKESFPEPVALLGPRIEVPQEYSSHDEDADGINDTQDLLDGARAEVRRKPTYQSAYYQGGYPPTEEGVCTDLVWRAFRDAGYDLKKLVDADIARRLDTYTRIDDPDPNIDFRRVPNLDVFFQHAATSLTTELKPGDTENLREWQGGDLVLFGKPLQHIGIVSDQRNADGVPLLIHNAGEAKEDDGLRYWSKYISPIIGHYRWPKE
jgi:uncharacterized protein YijF (DUF1287 family)